MLRMASIVTCVILALLLTAGIGGRADQNSGPAGPGGDQGAMSSGPAATTQPAQMSSYPTTGPEHASWRAHPGQRVIVGGKEVAGGGRTFGVGAKDVAVGIAGGTVNAAEKVADKTKEGYLKVKSWVTGH